MSEVARFESPKGRIFVRERDVEMDLNFDSGMTIMTTKNKFLIDGKEYEYEDFKKEYLADGGELPKGTK